MTQKTSILVLLAAFFMVTHVFGQLPSSFTYQSVLRDSSGELIVSQEVTLDVSILQGGPEGSVAFSEMHTTHTNAFGAVNLTVGSVESMDQINWGDDVFYMSITLDGEPVTTTQLLSVPYALHSKMAGDAFSGNYEDLQNLPDLEPFISVDDATPGDMLLFDGESWVTLSAGVNGQALIIKSGNPTWGDIGETDE